MILSMQTLEYNMLQTLFRCGLSLRVACGISVTFWLRTLRGLLVLLFLKALTVKNLKLTARN